MTAPWPVLLMARALDVGGTERQLAEMARGFDKRRFQAHVAAFHASGIRADELRAAGVPVTEFPVRSFGSLSAVSGALAMRRYIKRHGIQLVHTWDVPLNLFGVPAARLFRVPVVLSSQRAYRDLTPGLTHRLLRVTDRLVDALVVNCRAVAADLEARDKVPAELIHWCPNGIDTAKFRPAPAERPPELRDASLVIGSLSVLRPEKGLDVLVDAFAAISGADPGLRLAIVGGGPQRAVLEEQARRLGVRSRCVFVDATADTPPWYRSFDIFVLPSRSEALSNSLMEAMACGCPVVASRVGGNTELLDSGDTGMLFECGDVDGLAAQLRLLVAKHTLRAELGARAAARMQDYSGESVAERMGDIYETLLRLKVKSRVAMMDRVA